MGKGGLANVLPRFVAGGYHQIRGGSSIALALRKRLCRNYTPMQIVKSRLPLPLRESDNC